MKHYDITWSRPDEPDLLMTCHRLPPRVLIHRLAEASANYGGVIIHAVVDKGGHNVPICPKG